MNMRVSSFLHMSNCSWVTESWVWSDSKGVEQAFTILKLNFASVRAGTAYWARRWRNDWQLSTEDWRDTDFRWKHSWCPTWPSSGLWNDSGPDNRQEREGKAFKDSYHLCGFNHPVTGCTEFPPDDWQIDRVEERMGGPDGVFWKNTRKRGWLVNFPFLLLSRDFTSWSFILLKVFWIMAKKTAHILDMIIKWRSKPLPPQPSWWHSFLLKNYYCILSVTWTVKVLSFQYTRGKSTQPLGVRTLSRVFEGNYPIKFFQKDQYGGRNRQRGQRWT